jgi:hypothetical protein
MNTRAIPVPPVIAPFLDPYLGRFACRGGAQASLHFSIN